MKLVQALKVLLLIFVVIAIVLPLVAQEDEPVSDDPVIVVDEGDSGEFRVDLIQIVIGLLSSFAAGGIVGIGGLAIFVDRIRNDVPTITAFERLAESYPPDTRELLFQLFKGVDSIGEVGKEIFDGVPIAGKSSFASTESVSRTSNEAPK